MNGDIYSGRYTMDEVKRLMDINSRPYAMMKPFNPFYKKAPSEHGPSWAEKREVNLFDLNLSVCALPYQRFKHQPCLQTVPH